MRVVIIGGGGGGAELVTWVFSIHAALKKIITVLYQNSTEVGSLLYVLYFYRRHNRILLCSHI